MMKVFVAGLLGLGLVAHACAQGAGMVGDWATPAGSVVRVYGCGTALCLRIMKLEPGSQATDTSNPKAELRERALCGLEIGTGFVKSSETEAGGGTIYDPDSGRTYKGTMRLDGAALKLRGSWGPFGRTESWTRTGAVAGCGR